MALNNRLKEVRQQSQFTQETLAQRVGVTRQTIIAVEKGKFVPSVKLALELAQALDRSLDEIFWLDGSQGGEL
jgi:putative transcriptional regulator